MTFMNLFEQLQAENASLTSENERLREAVQVGLTALVLSNMPETSLVRDCAIAEARAALQPANKDQDQ